MASKTAQEWGDHMSGEDLLSLVSFFHSTGNLGKVRKWLQRQLKSIKASLLPVTTKNKAEKLEDILHIKYEMDRTADPDQKEKLRQQILAMVAKTSKNKAPAVDSKQVFYKAQESKIHAALAFATKLEKSGMSLESLARPSNRAQRFKGPQVTEDQLKPMSEMDVDGAPVTIEDTILMGDEPVPGAIAFQEFGTDMSPSGTDMSPSGTDMSSSKNRFLTDQAIDFPLSLPPAFATRAVA